ncbi:MAG: hypothetical protein E7375_03930 [Clostridiales bacterium]|nr:hypothetical protein [Clostridiales bacterium]
MTLESKRNWLLILQIFCLIEGILMCITIVGAIFGAFAIIASNKFKAMKEKDDQTLTEAIKKKDNLGWAVFSIFACGIVGVLGMVFVYFLDTTPDKKDDNIIDI